MYKNKQLIFRNNFQGGRMKALASGLQIAFIKYYKEDQGDENFVVLSKKNINRKIGLLKIEFSERLTI